MERRNYSGHQMFLCQMMKTSDFMKGIRKDLFLHLHFKCTQFYGTECHYIHLQRGKYFTGVYKRHLVKNVFYKQDQSRFGFCFSSSMEP